jgi:hypothetical protein
MENSNPSFPKDADSQKLLYKYQYAFLTMQKSFTALIKIFRHVIQKRMFKAVQVWRFSITIPVMRVKIQISLLKKGMSTIETKFFLIQKQRTRKWFKNMILSSNLKAKSERNLKQISEERDKSQSELNIMDYEVKCLKSSQMELEVLANSSSKGDLSLKNKKIKISTNELIEKIRMENREIEEQIKSLDRKTVELFEELNTVLDNWESNKKNKGKKTKKKIVFPRKSVLQL